MVKELNKANQKFYLCEACGFGYRDIETAKQCENYCNEHSSCSTEITRHAIMR